LDHAIETIKIAEEGMSSGNYLDKIIAQKKQEVERLIQETNVNPGQILNFISKQSRPVNAHFSKALKGVKLSVIAEVKRRSPSLGDIRKIDNPQNLALEYCQGGASAISVLTDEKYFGGSLKDLAEVSGLLSLNYPQVSLLRKDFIIHPLQLAQAVLAGANAVLLIAAAAGKDLRRLIDEAKNLGLEVLTEVHDLEDLELALEANADIIGINHRNLKSFEIDLSISKTLLSLIPPHVITVAESGIHEPLQAKQMRNLGFDAILVGEALVRSKSPSTLIRQMREGSYEN
jgi:indole-3-glycerol phosphate synthase